MRRTLADPSRRDRALAALLLTALLLTALLLPSGSVGAAPLSASITKQRAEHALARLMPERVLAKATKGVKKARRLLKRAVRDGVPPPRQAELLAEAADVLFGVQAGAAEALNDQNVTKPIAEKLQAIRTTALTTLDEVRRAYDGPVAAVEAAYLAQRPADPRDRRRALLHLSEKAFEPLRRVLSNARFAPSPDNAQPWGFEIVDPTTFVVVGQDPIERFGPYDLKRHAYWTSLGMLLENIRIAARAEGLKAKIVRMNHDDASPRFKVTLVASKARATPRKTEIAALDMAAMRFRTTQRRKMSRRPLRDHDKAALQASLGDGYEVVWLDSLAERRAMARLNARTGKLRLTTPEAAPVHRAVVDSGSGAASPDGDQLSADRVPANAVGLGPLTKHLMLRLLDRPRLLEFFNNFLGGTAMPVLQLDVLPALFTGAHFLIVAKHGPPEGLEDLLAAGAATQRFLLEAAKRGLKLQPNYMPLTVATYGAEAGAAPGEPPGGAIMKIGDLGVDDDGGQTNTGPYFSRSTEGRDAELTIRSQLKALAMAHGVALDKIVFLGRAGYGKPPKARSLRLPLEALILDPARTDDEGLNAQ